MEDSSAQNDLAPMWVSEDNLQPSKVTSAFPEQAIHDESWPMSPFEGMHLPRDEAALTPICHTAIEPPAPPNRSIYALQTRPGYGVTVSPYQASWPVQFETIKSHLDKLFTTSTPITRYKTIEHIGSTSVPGLSAKPKIDVLVTLPSRGDLDAAIEALEWEVPEGPPYTRYTRVPNGGGIQGRESFQLHVPHWSEYYYGTPERSVYLIEDSVENWRGRVQIRCYRSVRDTLSDPVNKDLLHEYGETKMRLSQQVYENAFMYSSLKDIVIRKILRRAGWAENEVDEKEMLSERTWVADEPAY